MKTFIVTLFFQKIPIWSDVIKADEPPELASLNERFGMFGDQLIVRQVKDNALLYRFKNYALTV